MTSESQEIAQGDLDTLLNEHFAGKIVRKDLTKLVKEGANVPVFVLEYLLGSYCASQDEEVVADGLRTVKRVLAEKKAGTLVEFAFFAAYPEPIPRKAEPGWDTLLPRLEKYFDESILVAQ